MTLPNRISLDDLPTMQAREIAALPADQLQLLQKEADERRRETISLSDRLDGAIALKYGDWAQEARRACGKDTGTVRLADGAVTVVADLPKKVEWDQAQLTALVERIRAGGEDPAEYIATELKVAGRAFTAWPEAIRQLFAPARTVRAGKPSYRFVSTGSAA